MLDLLPTIPLIIFHGSLGSLHLLLLILVSMNFVQPCQNLALSHSNLGIQSAKYSVIKQGKFGTEDLLLILNTRHLIDNLIGF